MADSKPLKEPYIFDDETLLPPTSPTRKFKFCGRLWSSTTDLVIKSLLLVTALIWTIHLLFTGSHCNSDYLDSNPVDYVKDYIDFETPIARYGLFANIGSNGERSSGAKPGVVIASPSTFDPDYLYTWIRDSSLVFKVIIDNYVTGRDHSAKEKISEWAQSMSNLQKIPNRSGDLATGGLGDPKFHIDETAFQGGWGRPQRDGPALRSISLITLANHLISQENTTFVKRNLWPIIQLDLHYVSNVWNMTGFDLWEEVPGSSFFTTAVQHRALREGVSLAKALNQNATFWETQADNALCLLQSYWDEEDGYIVANVNHQGRIRSGLDSNTVLGSIHTFDPKAGCSAATFQPCSDKALANLKRYVDSFRGDIYPINKDIPHDKAVALGRYPEDYYYNGNPWYLTTFAVAEQLYRAVHTWDQIGSGINVTSISLPFFQQFLPGLKKATSISKDSKDYSTIISKIKDFADGFVLVGAAYTPKDGSLAEQFTKTTGSPISAQHLTWSYASALTAFDARANKEVVSWGAGDLEVPKVCKANPGPQAKLSIKFFVDTVWGENVFFTGNMDAIGYWAPERAIPLKWVAPGVWSTEISITASTYFEYKFFKKLDNGILIWESDPNRIGTTPAEGHNGTIETYWR